MMIRAIEPNYLNFYWGKIFPQVRDAIKYSGDEQGPYHVYEKIESGEYVLLVALEGEEVIAHCTMSKTVFPNKTILNLITVGGSRMNEWLDDILKVIERIGKEMGCNAIYTCGRIGWSKLLKDFKPQYTICTKEIL